MLINSRHNEKIKFIASLKQKKYRDETGLYIVEGVKMVREAFSYGKTVKTVLCTEEFYSEFSGAFAEVILVSPAVLKHASDAVTPQGVLAVVEKDSADHFAPSGVSVCLDGVTDAGNLGTILRICASLNIKDVYLIDCVDAYSPKTVRSSMSGLYLVNIHTVSFDEFCDISRDIPLIVADMDGENVFNANAKEKFCLVLGSEAHGVSERMLSLKHNTLKIPMLNGMESLNVGVSAGIILYQLLKNTLK